MRRIPRFLGRRKKGRDADSDSVERGVQKVTDPTPFTDVVSPGLEKDTLYSTEGSIGMKFVSDPPDAILDIVFVHGLTGNRDTTWTHENGVFWPQQLGEDIQNARIMTFGYDADVVKFWGMAGSNNLRGHGKNLATAVSDRRRECRSRPIIFIAHSLGGLVCEQGLLICGEGDKNLEKVFHSTIGIIFMGTPHSGADLADWGYTLAIYLNVVRNTNSAILGVLKRKSEVLTAVQQQFQQLLRKPSTEIEIYCFFEEKAVVGVGVIVPEQSAVLSQYPNQSIASNHMDMTKFSGRSDEGYQRVLSRVHDQMESMKSFNESPELQNKHPDYEKRVKCHKIFRTSEYERYKERNPEHVKGTCQWILQHPRYISWRNSVDSSILWVSADPGCGKSVLSKFLADEELEGCQERTTCYFFFKDDNEEQKTATNALCALLHQLFDRKPELIKHAVEVVDKNGENLKKNIDLLWTILTTASSDPQAGEVICILDALDECRESELKYLLHKICSFYQSPPTHQMSLKFIVTSRPLQHIEGQFSKLSHKIPTIRLAGEEETVQISCEINLVIEAELVSIQQETLADSKTISSLREEFSKVEHRTYLWLKLIFDLIRQDLQYLTKRGRQKIFGAIPDSVNAAYTAILSKSTNMDQARKLLQIICAAIRPLSVREMTMALSIEPYIKVHDDIEITSEEHSKRLIRNLCGLFVSIVDGRVYLLHQTAKEFLMAQNDLIKPNYMAWKHSISPRESNFLLADMCMWYLRLDEFNRDKALQGGSEEIAKLVTKYDFLEYSAANWAAHFQAALIPNGHTSIGLALELCDTQAGRHRIWPQLYWRLAEYGELPNGLQTLHLASLFGHQEVVRQLLKAPETEVNAQDESSQTPLWWAAYKGHKEVVRQLLAALGIEVNARDNDGQTPLWIAVYKGHEEVVGQLLAAPGVEVNARGNNSGQTPLWKAAYEGHKEVIRQLLVAPGIEVNARDNNNETPLFGAVYEGHEEVVRQLLAAPGIEVNARDNNNETPLFGAVYEGHEEVVRQLLAAPGVEVNARGNNSGQTPLWKAAYKGHKEVVRQLLADPGVEVNARDNDNKTPLGRAGYAGHEEVVRQLLAAPGIEVNARDNDNRTPLWWASYAGHKAIVKLLENASGVY